MEDPIRINYQSILHQQLQSLTEAQNIALKNGDYNFILNVSSEIINLVNEINSINTLIKEGE